MVEPIRVHVRDLHTAAPQKEILAAMPCGDQNEHYTRPDLGAKRSVRQLLQGLDILLEILQDRLPASSLQFVGITSFRLK